MPLHFNVVSNQNRLDEISRLLMHFGGEPFTLYELVKVEKDPEKEKKHTNTS